MLEDKAHPLLVVGMEGVWGLLIMALIVVPWAALLPGHDAGACMENTYDSFVMIQNSRTVRSRNGTTRALDIDWEERKVRGT